MFDRCDAIVANTVDLLGTDSGPCVCVKSTSEISSSYWRSAVLALVLPAQTSRLSRTTVSNPSSCEALRDECPVMPAPRDDYIAAQILLQCWINAQQAIL